MSILVVSLVLAFVLPQTVKAESAGVAPHSGDVGTEGAIETTFSLEEIDQEGSVTETFVDENGNVNEVKISVDNRTEDKQISKAIQPLILQNKTYTIKHTKTGSYTASYKINVYSEKITSAHSKSISLSMGSLGNNSLVKNSSTQATLSFTQKLVLGSINNKIVTTVGNGKLKTIVTP